MLVDDLLDTWQRDTIADSGHTGFQMSWLIPGQQDVQISMVSSDCTERRENREDNQRCRHDPRRLMSMVMDMLITRRTAECVEPQAKHVERRDARGQQGYQEQQIMDWIGIHECQCRRHDRVFGMVA